MVRLALKLALASAALWAVWTYVPVHGRTLADRWRAAASPADFVQRGWAEATGAPARPARPQARQRPSPAPTESHTDADRRAVDRLLSDRLEQKR